MLSNAVIIFCAYFKKITEFAFDSEVYSDYTAFCLKSGKFSYRIDQDDEKILLPGEIVLCPPGKSFARKIIEPAEMCMIKFRINSDADVLCDKIRCSDLLRFNRNMEKLESCIFCYDMDENPVFRHFCLDTVYIYNESINHNTPFSDIKNYIELNYNTDISVSKMAKKSGYSVQHFINLFKTFYGASPKQYVLNLRLQKAKMLLITTDKTVKEIAYSCGFNDELYFLRFFKRYAEMTPKEFRKNKI